MNTPISLQGLSWDHSRAFPPVVAAAQRYEETHPGVRITWVKHSLHEFGHAPVDILAQTFDLLIIDHPWMEYAFQRHCLLPLRHRLTVSSAAEMERDSTGGSFASYSWAGDLWAVPIDAACPAAFWRPDRVLRYGPLPSRWTELIEWAEAGRVIAPGFGPDLVLHLFALCATEDENCGGASDCFAPQALALESLERLRELFSLLRPEVFDLNPIRVHEFLASVDGPGPDYCPFAYTYNNYGRIGYGGHPLRFGDPPAAPSGRALRTVLGGTGLAVSARCLAPEVAVDFASFAASARVQSTLYVQAGGQPARRSAWSDALANQLTGNFFRATLGAMERAWIRPRFSGFVAFQEQAGAIIRRWIQTGGSPGNCLASMNEIWRKVRSS